MWPLPYQYSIMFTAYQYSSIMFTAYQYNIMFTAYHYSIMFTAYQYSIMFTAYQYSIMFTAYQYDEYQYVCMYVRMVITYSRVWINRVRLPENLVSRDGFSRPVPRQPAHIHTQAESGAYLRDSSRVPRRRPFMKPPYAIGSVPSLSGHAIAYRWRSLLRVRRHRASKPQGSSSNECCLDGSPWTN